MPRIPPAPVPSNSRPVGPAPTDGDPVEGFPDGAGFSPSGTPTSTPRSKVGDEGEPGLDDDLDVDLDS